MTAKRPPRIVGRVAGAVPTEQRADLRHRLGRFRPGETGFDYVAPACRSGERTGPPDFVGVGVPAAGVGWWSTLVTGPAGVTGPRGTGMATHFLSQFAVRSLDADQVARYHALFPRRPGEVAGEWTPTYLGDPWVAPLLGIAAPEAKVLCLVREPVERLRQQLHQTADRRVANAGAHMSEAIDHGFYARWLRVLLEVVPADRVLVLQFERCVADSVGQLARTHRFLGLEPGRHSGRFGHPHRPVVLPALEADVERRLVDLYAADVAELTSLVHGLDLALWPRFAAGT